MREQAKRAGKKGRDEFAAREDALLKQHAGEVRAADAAQQDSSDLATDAPVDGTDHQTRAPSEATEDGSQQTRKVGIRVLPDL